MVPNGSAYSNFPAFANNGTKTPPGGSTESAKYALGMVPADTFPAEWANYLFHGATAGITRLNQDTGSIKKEINSVLSNFNITPDPTLNNQLLEALNKLKAEAALAAHPVGSLYWTSVNENPAVIFGGGTWTQIKDRFILAAGDTYSNGATGGAATVTLTTNEIPSHNHTGTTDGGGVDHTHNMEHRHYTSGRTGDDSPDHTHTDTGGGTGAITFVGAAVPGPYFVNTTTSGASTRHQHDFAGWSNGYLYNSALTATFTNTGGATAYVHTHGFTTGSTGGGQAHENMPPYIGKYCWERTA